MDGNLSELALNERLANSWQRSLAAGLSPSTHPTDLEHLGGFELRRILEQNHDLVCHSRPIMDYLFEQVRHSNSMVILADSHGVLMHTLGDVDFLSRAERIALMAGACWDENKRGTNAIGTALADEEGIEIHGDEHFLERNTILTCAAAPILSGTGELLGVLDISGDRRCRHPHTPGLINTAARVIENRIIANSCNRHLLLHIHPDPAGIGTFAEGIVALSEDGRIVGSNRSALPMLGLNRAGIGTIHLRNILDTCFSDIFDRYRRFPGQILSLRRHDGSLLHARLENQAHRILGVPKPATDVCDDALTALDTGDERWRTASRKARRVIGKDIPLLIGGESGVGKEMFARAVHQSSPRSKGPFVAINCAALPENLIEAELFGYVAGAFTGARKDGYIGRLREADGGTLFLDEIGDMPLSMQTRLLRVLQERQVTPLGGGKPIKVCFALICATHCNLPDACAKGSFRSDLYYRINGLTLQLPALRERSDFFALCDKLLNELFPDTPTEIAADLRQRMAGYGWPGNLRQLASVLRTSGAMLDDGENLIDWHHLPDDILLELQATKTIESSPPQASEQTSPDLASMSLMAIRQAVDKHLGNVSAAARQLGISRQTLYRKLKFAPQK